MEIPYYILYAPQGGVERRERTTVPGLLLHGIKALCHRNSGAGTQRKETGPHIPSLSVTSVPSRYATRWDEEDMIVGIRYVGWKGITHFTIYILQTIFPGWTGRKENGNDNR